MLNKTDLTLTLTLEEAALRPWSAPAGRRPIEHRKDLVGTDRRDDVKPGVVTSTGSPFT